MGQKAQTDQPRTAYGATSAQRRALRTYVALVRASEAVSRRIHVHVQAAGLTVSRFAVLEALLHLGPCTQAVLGQKILRSPNNVTTVVDNLERAGLVERRHDEADRRVRVVHLTGTGRALIEELFPRHARVVADDLSVLDDDELETLAELCKRVGLRDTTATNTDPETRDDDKETT